MPSALTVNVTCVDCDGNPPCAVCRAAARAITASGHRVEHSSRYDALRAAASGTYGFEACLVTIGANERAVADAVRALLPGQRVALVVENPEIIGSDLPANYVVLSHADYLKGNLPAQWLVVAASTPVAHSRRTPGGATSAGATSTSATPAGAARRVAALAAKMRAPGLDTRLPLDPDPMLDDEIAWAAACGAAFAIVLIRMPGPGERSGAGDQTRQTRAAAAGAIAAAVRRGDPIGARGDEFVIALPEADAAAGALVAARIADAIRRAPFAARLPSKKLSGAAGWTIGVAAYPADGDSGAALRARAKENSRALI